MTLTLRLNNPTAQPFRVTFPSGQRYDFVVTDSTTGREVWRWAAGKAFTMTFAEQSVPAQGALAFKEQWKPAARGPYIVRGLLVSTSHGEAYASVAVP